MTVKEALQFIREYMRPAQPMVAELRALQPEIERLLPILEGTLPGVDSFEYRRLARDVRALATKLKKLEARIRHVRPEMFEVLEMLATRLKPVTQGEGDGQD